MENGIVTYDHTIRIQDWLNLHTINQLENCASTEHKNTQLFVMHIFTNAIISSTFSYIVYADGLSDYSSDI